MDAVVASQAGLNCGDPHPKGPTRNCTNKDIIIISYQEVQSLRRLGLVTPQSGMVAFQINLTAKSPEMATFAYGNLTQSLSNDTFKRALTSNTKTYLQFISAIKNNMFCDGSTFKCPLFPLKKDQTPLKVTKYIYSEYSLLMVSNLNFVASD